MKVSLKDKVDIYENFLKRIASIDVEKECKDAFNHPYNPAKSSELFMSKYPFAFGMIEQVLKGVVTDAQYALNQGAK
jgi:hypothetical protein